MCYIQTGRHFGLQYSNYMCGKSQMTIYPEYSSFSGYCIEKLFQLPCVWRAKSLQSCLTVCNPMDHSLPGSSVHEVLQVRILEWVDISFFISCHSQLKRQESSDCCLLKMRLAVVVVVQLLSCVRLSSTPGTAACQASLSSTISQFAQIHVH